MDCRPIRSLRPWTARFSDPVSAAPFAIVAAP
jgi:hypothetical protein